MKFVYVEVRDEGRMTVTCLNRINTDYTRGGGEVKAEGRMPVTCLNRINTDYTQGGGR